MHRSTTGYHMPQLDALRGIAALIVVISHSANAGLIHSSLGSGFGQMGVGLFYALSAFLLTHLYANNPPNIRSIKDYLVRRAARILPLFYAVFVASLFIELSTGVSLFGAFDTLAVGVRNVFLIHGTGVLWSIPVEIQFYLVFVIFWVLIIVDFRVALVFLILFQSSVLLISSVANFHQHSLAFYMHFFTFGCIAAIIFQNTHLTRIISRSRILKAILTVLILLTPVLLPAVRRDLFDLEWVPIFMDPVAIIWVAGIFVAFVFSIFPTNWVDNKYFRVLGELSFGVYLIHMGVLRAVQTFPFEGAVSKAIGFVIVVLVTYMLAAIVNRFFERPAQKWILKSIKKPTARRAKTA